MAVSLRESEEGMRDTEGASHWLGAFGAEAAVGEVTGLDWYEVVASEALRAHPQPRSRGFIIHPTAKTQMVCEARSGLASVASC